MKNNDKPVSNQFRAERDNLLRFIGPQDLDAMIAALNGVNEWARDITGGHDSELMIESHSNEVQIYFKEDE